jgi:predicted transcriptional regulator of viral defense system
MAMEFNDLLTLVGDIPVFESALLLAGNVNPGSVRVQLTRWSKSGRVMQLRRGLYTLAPPFQKVKPHPFLVANLIQRASYVSVQSALAYYGLIPEIVHTTLSVSTGRPEHRETPLGIFEFRHVRTELLRGYRMTELQGLRQPSQQALVATPEMALLYLIYWPPGGDNPAYLRALRLQNMERLDMNELCRQAQTFNAPKLQRAVETIAQMAKSETQEYESL